MATVLPQKRSKIKSVYGASNVPLHLNRNPMNFPLARSGRSKARWKWDERKDRWWAALPQERRIRVRFPPGTKRRLPTGFDTNVLQLLLAEARASNVVTLPTATVILRHLGLSSCSRERDRLLSSLRLLSRIQTSYLHWYLPHNDTGRMDLPPPIKSWKRERSHLIVEIDPAWLALTAKSFSTNVPLPLPLNAAAQNLVLMIFGMDGKWPELNWDRSTYARKAGIGPKNRKALLQAALQRAQDWFREQGGGLDVVFQGGRMKLTVTPPSAAERDESAEFTAWLKEQFGEEMAQDEDIAAENAQRRDGNASRTIHDPFADR